MKRTRIAIASILKPVDETRMYEKMGRSLVEAGYEIHIAGHSGKTTDKSISLYPLFNFTRLSLNRIKAPLEIFHWLKKIRPEIIIINTHELLIVAVIYKILFGSKLVYDIRENYSLNIKKTDAFPNYLRILIANYVRLKERIFSSWIDHFFLAETGYKYELNFIKKRYTILENKAVNFPLKKSPKNASPNRELLLIFTGTIAESTGIFECIEMAKRMNEFSPQIRLKIIGACHISETYKKLEILVSQHPWITLSGGRKTVGHHEVIEAIQNADGGFIFYPDTSLIENKIPTKLYEYLTGQLPILLQSKKEWVELANKYNAAIAIDLENFNAKEVISALQSDNFYTTTPGNEVLWYGEAKKMLNIINNILP